MKKYDFITKEFLIREYTKNKKSPYKLAKELGCSKTPIYNRLKKYSIYIRTISESLKGIKRYFTKKHKQKLKENHANFSNENHPKYIDGRTKAKHYCIESGCSNEITRFSGIYGLGRCKSCASKISSTGRKQTKEAKRKMSLTKGGTGIPYENNNYPEKFFKIRLKIRKRDNYTCQLCETKFDKYSSYLDAHHIDYDKENINPENLISLCHKCNMGANTNRDYWFAYFTYLMGHKQ